VPGSFSYNVVTSPALAYEAAKQFGLFAKLLSGFNATELEDTIPHFHDLSLRYRQFEQSLQQAAPERLHHAKAIINSLQCYKNILREYEEMIKDSSFKKKSYAPRYQNKQCTF